MTFFGTLASGLSGAASGTLKATSGVATGAAKGVAFYALAGACTTIFVIMLIYQIVVNGFGGISAVSWGIMLGLMALAGFSVYKIYASAAEALGSTAQIFDSTEQSINNYRANEPPTQSPYVVNLNGAPQPTPQPSTLSSVPAPLPAIYSPAPAQVAGGSGDDQKKTH